MQDGLDLIEALANHPETAQRLARRLWTWFVNETEPAPDDFVDAIAGVYLNKTRACARSCAPCCISREFTDRESRVSSATRGRWNSSCGPSRKSATSGFSANDALTPLENMGQQLYEPPDVNGWDLGPAWFSTGGMLSRMNFASQLATNQRVALRDAARPFAGRRDALVDFCYRPLSLPSLIPTSESRSSTTSTSVARGPAPTRSC